MAIATDMAAAGRRRWRLVGQNAGAQILSRIVSGLCQLALVPLLLGALGTDSFGWTMVLMAFVAMSQFGDLGVALALQQALSEASARQDERAVRRIYAGGVRLLRRLGAAWLVIALPAAWWWGPRALTAIPGTHSQELCWLMVAFAACAGVPLSAGTRLAAGLQLAWITAGWTAAVNLVTVAGVWLLARSGHSQPAVFLAGLCAGQLAPGWITERHLRTRLAWRGDDVVDTTEGHRLWQTGLPLAGAVVSGALVQMLAPVAVATFGGYGASAAYSVLQRLFGVAQQGHALLLGPLWPAYAEAAARGEDAWLRRTFMFSLALSAAAAAGVTLATALLPGVLPVWLGPDAPVVTPAFAWLVAAAVIGGMFAQALSYLVLGLGRLRTAGRVVAAAHIATLVVMFSLGNLFGGTGVAAGLALGTLGGLLPLLAREARDALRAVPQNRSTNLAPDSSG